MRRKITIEGVDEFGGCDGCEMEIEKELNLTADQLRGQNSYAPPQRPTRSSPHRVKLLLGVRSIKSSTESEAEPYFGSETAATAAAETSGRRRPRGTRRRSAYSKTPPTNNASAAAGIAPCRMRPKSSSRTPVKIGCP
jgi:hypothetical protein